MSRSVPARTALSLCPLGGRYSTCTTHDGHLLLIAVIAIVWNVLGGPLICALKLATFSALLVRVMFRAL